MKASSVSDGSEPGPSKAQKSKAIAGTYTIDQRDAVSVQSHGRPMHREKRGAAADRASVSKTSFVTANAFPLASSLPT